MIWAAALCIRWIESPRAMTGSESRLNWAYIEVLQMKAPLWAGKVERYPSKSRSDWEGARLLAKNREAPDLACKPPWMGFRG
jgi:hypothetical protein